MKDILKKYYGIEVENIQNYNDGIIFFVNGDNYYFCKCKIENIEDSYEIYLELKEKNIILHDFIFNNQKELLSEEYVLLKLNYLIDDIDINDLAKFQQVTSHNYYDNFYNIWTNKIDYFEKRLLDGSENKIINYSFDYFVGIAEMLLIYYKDNNEGNSNNYIVHRTFYTLNTIDFYNPLNIVTGDKYKDIAAYIKLTNNWNLLYNILNKISDSDKKMLFIRIVFPYYYFYLINNHLNGVDEESGLLNLLNRIENYENYLAKIERIFNINLFYWIKKDN